MSFEVCNVSIDVNVIFSAEYDYSGNVYKRFLDFKNFQ